MFERVLQIEADRRHQIHSRTRVLTASRGLPLAAAAHLAIIGGLVAAQSWRVAPVFPVDARVVFTRFVERLPVEETKRETERRPGVRETQRAALPQPESTPRGTPVPEPTTPAIVPGNFESKAATLDPGPSEFSSTVGTTNSGLEGDSGAGARSEAGSWERYQIGMTRPVVLHRVEPTYTEPARRGRIEGLVVVEAHIDRDGRVLRVAAVQALPFGLTDAAVDAVSRWRFAPARRAGVPVPVIYTVTVRFALKG